MQNSALGAARPRLPGGGSQMHVPRSPPVSWQSQRRGEPGAGESPARDAASRGSAACNTERRERTEERRGTRQPTSKLRTSGSGGRRARGNKGSEGGKPLSVAQRKTRSRGQVFRVRGRGGATRSWWRETGGSAPSWERPEA